MSTYERAAAIIAECGVAPIPLDKAKAILDALMQKRYIVVAMKASHDMFTRFHSHARFLGTETGQGYEQIYNDAIAFAVEQDLWPTKLVVTTVNIGGEDISVDVQIPESTTKASNKQLLSAYSYVEDTAKEHGISLPENEGVT